MSILRSCPSSIPSADHGVAHPPRCPEGWFWRGCCGVWHARTMQVSDSPEGMLWGEECAQNFDTGEICKRSARKVWFELLMLTKLRSIWLVLFTWLIAEFTTIEATKQSLCFCSLHSSFFHRFNSSRIHYFSLFSALVLRMDTFFLQARLCATYTHKTIRS